MSAFSNMVVLDSQSKDLPKEVHDDIFGLQQDAELHQGSFFFFDVEEYEEYTTEPYKQFEAYHHEAEYPNLTKFIRDAGYTQVHIHIWW